MDHDGLGSKNYSGNVTPVADTQSSCQDKMLAVNNSANRWYVDICMYHD